MESAEVMIIASRTQPCFCASSTIRAARVDRELAELALQRRQLINRRLLVGGDRPEFFQQTHAVLNVAFIRRFDERKRRDVAQPQRGHLQDNGRRVGAQNFRVGKLRARQEIV